MSDKKTYTQNEALEICFEQIKPNNLSKSDYNKFAHYRRRYNSPDEKLGQLAIDNLLGHFGFNKIETITYYTKERTAPK